LVADVACALRRMPMDIRLPPFLLTRINWEDVLNCPVFRQFIPMQSALVNDHPMSQADSLNEWADSKVPGLVHRYPNKALFLATHMCSVYCSFCTRAYMVGTGAIDKRPMIPNRERWEKVFEYLRLNDAIHDVVLSGGDVYTLSPTHFHLLLNGQIPHIKRIRIGSKGLCAVPGRIVDPTDKWTEVLLRSTNRAVQLDKELCLHTHFNHVQEINGITREAARFLYQNGVTVRNQSVLLKGVNDTLKDLKDLIQALADLHISPYYIYQCDMTIGIEHLRTRISDMKRLEMALQGSTTGYYTPKFVVDLPGGGGKRIISTHDTYDEDTGISTWRAPALGGAKAERIYKYYDPKPVELGAPLEPFPLFPPVLGIRENRGGPSYFGGS
ncbi:hypothetical protein EK21DRAFT_75286, partial [Setomelanomma holmii]